MMADVSSHYRSLSRREPRTEVAGGFHRPGRHPQLFPGGGETLVTQPAFSRRIRSLEDALGLTLVNRQRTPVELTEAGQLFLVTARSVVEQLGQVVRHLHHLEGGQGEVLQFAAAHSLALGFFPQWIARLRNEGLNIASRLIATNVGEAVHSLREGSCDLMLAFYDPDAALQMDPEIFPSLHLGRTEMLPVCAVNAEGLPLFDLENGQSVPLLAYSASAFLGRGSTCCCASATCATPRSTRRRWPTA